MLSQSVFLIRYDAQVSTLILFGPLHRLELPEDAQEL